MGVVLGYAVVGNGRDTGGGREGEKVFTTFFPGGPERCFELEHPCPLPSQQVLHKPHSVVATRLHPSMEQRGLVTVTGGAERRCGGLASCYSNGGAPTDCV